MKMNDNNENLKEANLTTLISQYNFTIPEIQREYVWGENEKVISDFLNAIKNKIGSNNLTDTYKLNIGFLYTYTPEGYENKQGKPADFNLIDGQQRFTTLFLLTFYLAIKENRKEEFKNLIRFQENVKMYFTFKVRNLTQQFLLEIIDKIDNLQTLKFIEKQTWFLNDYKNDISIKAMLKTLFYIHKIFFDCEKFYKKVLNHIYFWHFKTEVTSQGEELYITMNARGKDLVNNEISKAHLFINELDLKEVGKKWEDWQHFFWKNKGSNENEDIGFN